MEQQVSTKCLSLESWDTYRSEQVSCPQVKDQLVTPGVKAQEMPLSYNWDFSASARPGLITASVLDRSCCLRL